MRRMKNVNSNRKTPWFRIFGLVVLAAFLVFAGCESNGAGDDGDSAPSQPSDEEFSKVSETGTQAAGTMSGSADPETRNVGSQLNLSLSLYSAFFVGYLEGWEGDTGTYTYGGVTITVERDGDTWRWIYTDSETGETMVYEIVRLSDRWEFAWTINGEVFIDGFVSFDGLTGEMTLYEDSTGNESYVLTWEPHDGEWYLVYTLEWYSSGTLEATATIRTNQDGSAGTYDYGGETNVSWP